MYGREGSRRGVDSIALLGTVLIPLTAAFFLPAVPESSRTSAGLIVGPATIGGLLVYLARSIRRDIRSRTGDITALLTGISTLASGTLFRGALRNVSLRVATVQAIMGHLVMSVPTGRRSTPSSRPATTPGRPGDVASSPSA